MVRGVDPRLSPAKGVNPKQRGVNPRQKSNYKKCFGKTFFIIPPSGTITSGFRVVLLLIGSTARVIIASTGMLLLKVVADAYNIVV